jgi:hypothetical protein
MLPGAPDPDDCNNDSEAGTSGTTGGRRSNNEGVTARCRCQRPIRLSESTYAQDRSITGGICHSEFTE